MRLEGGHSFQLQQQQQGQQQSQHCEGRDMSANIHLSGAVGVAEGDATDDERLVRWGDGAVCGAPAEAGGGDGARGAGKGGAEWARQARGAWRGGVDGKDTYLKRLRTAQKPPGAGYSPQARGEDGNEKQN